MAGTTFEKYGGFGAVSKIVMDFYDLVLDSDTVGHHFDDIDMPRLMDHQTKFISALMGGPSSISDERLRMAHHKISITDAEFDEVAQMLVEVMQEHGVKADDIAQVVAAVEEKRPLIVRRDTS